MTAAVRSETARSGTGEKTIDLICTLAYRRLTGSFVGFSRERNATTRTNEFAPKPETVNLEVV
jgi:hypothetical protein